MVRKKEEIESFESWTTRLDEAGTAHSPVFVYQLFGGPQPRTLKFEVAPESSSYYCTPRPSPWRNWSAQRQLTDMPLALIHLYIASGTNTRGTSTEASGTNTSTKA